MVGWSSELLKRSPRYESLKARGELSTFSEKKMEYGAYIDTFNVAGDGRWQTCTLLGDE